MGIVGAGKGPQQQARGCPPPHTSAAALALLVLALLWALSAPLTRLCALAPRAVLGAAEGGAAGAPLPGQLPLPQPFVRDTLHSPPCAAPFYLYADLDLITELPFLTSVVFAGAREACGACLQLRQRIEFPIHVRVGMLDCAAFALAVTFEMSGDELAALRERRALAGERLLYVHLSDEHEDRSVEGYDLPRLILRNYFSSSLDRQVNITYLMDAPDATPPARALWVPLGFAEGFMPQLSQALNLPAGDRPLAWSWAGSKDGKWARDYFLRGLDAFPQREALLAAGRLHVYLKFMDGGMMKPIKYSSWLYESRVAPCPNGGSAEQFRVWEALLAGAIPIVPAGSAHLHYLHLLGFRVLQVGLSRWAEDPPPS